MIVLYNVLYEHVQAWLEDGSVGIFASSPLVYMLNVPPLYVQPAFLPLQESYIPPYNSTYTPPSNAARVSFALRNRQPW